MGRGHCSNINWKMVKLVAMLVVAVLVLVLVLVLLGWVDRVLSAFPNTASSFLNSLVATACMDTARAHKNIRAFI